MNKQEFILSLTQLLVKSQNRNYSNGIIDAIREAHSLDESLVRSDDKLDVAMKQYLTRYRYLIQDKIQEIKIMLQNGNTLMAVKAYKDENKEILGLKEAKEEIDLVRKFGL